MNSSLQNSKRKCQIYEAIAWFVFVVLYVIGLFSNSIHIDPFLDTVYLIGGAYLVFTNRKSQDANNKQELKPSRTSQLQLYVCIYLFVDAVLLLFMVLFYPSLLLLFYLALSILYGAALRLRLKEENNPFQSYNWQRLFQPPALLLTVGIAAMLFCMYLPMQQYYRQDYIKQAWILPSVMYQGIYTYGEVNLKAGFDVINTKGYQAPFGHLACLVLAAIAVVHIATTQTSYSSRTSLFMKIGLLFIVLWWLFALKGYQSFTNIANLVFVAGCVLLVAMFFNKEKQQSIKNN